MKILKNMCMYNNYPSIVLLWSKRSSDFPKIPSRSSRTGKAKPVISAFSFCPVKKTWTPHSVETKKIISRGPHANEVMMQEKWHQQMTSYKCKEKDIFSPHSPSRACRNAPNETRESEWRGIILLKTWRAHDNARGGVNSLGEEFSSKLPLIFPAIPQWCVLFSLIKALHFDLHLERVPWRQRTASGRKNFPEIGKEP